MTATLAVMPPQIGSTICCKRSSSPGRLSSRTTFRTSSNKENDSNLCIQKAPVRKSIGADTVCSSRTDRTFSRADSVTSNSIISEPFVIAAPSAGQSNPLSQSFPISRQPENYILLRTGRRETQIQSRDNNGVIVGTLEPLPSSVESKRRQLLLKDAGGHVCAMIFHRQEGNDGPHVFTIFGFQPAFKRQKRSYDNKYVKGYFKWAEVRNLGGLGGQFALVHTRETKNRAKTPPTFVAKPFGSLFRPKKRRGHIAYNEKEKVKSAVITSLSSGKGVTIAPNEDAGLMLCYAAIIDYMIQHRLR